MDECKHVGIDEKGLDKLRRGEHRELMSKGDERLTGLRQLLLYNEENFDEGGQVEMQILQKSDLMVINDEAHHCYREKPPEESEEADLQGKDEKDEAKENSEAARLWINGIEAVNRTMGVSRVIDLSATPFFLRGSGYAEGTLFPWTMSDFSLMDAIESGVVKLPRVPIADNLPGGEMPMYRNLWEHIRNEMPKAGRSKATDLQDQVIPGPLATALVALYNHYEKTFQLWKDGGIDVPPCFIVVCNNTSSSKVVYDYVSGYYRTHSDGTETPVAGALKLFQNFDPDNFEPYPQPRTLLIDSGQLESGEARKYRPDFIVIVDTHPSLADASGCDFLTRSVSEDPDRYIHLVVEIKGYRGEDAREKASTMKTYWIPGVNNLGTYGRWAFAEFTEVFQMEADFEEQVAGRFDQMVDDAIRGQQVASLSV